MTQAQRKDAIKYLTLLMENCRKDDDKHSWHDCPRCLAFNRLQFSRDKFAMKMLAAAIEALNDATPRT